MDETSASSPPASLEPQRRRLLFRANHRGTKETDFLVGGFVTARLESFTQAEIETLEAIMELPDPLLADWLTGRLPIPPEHDQPMLRAMRDAAGQETPRQ
jgi:antitoxin CptB